MTNHKKQSNGQKNYINPQMILDRWKAGEISTLRWAIQEYVHLKIQEQAYYGKEYYECPRTIARAFGCKTAAVKDAFRARLDTVIVRTGVDGDDRRVWIICKDKQDRQRIRAAYRAPWNKDQRGVQIPWNKQSSVVSSTTENVLDNSRLGAATSRLGAAIPTPLKGAARSRDIRVLTPHTPLNIKKELALSRSFPIKDSEGTGTNGVGTYSPVAPCGPVSVLSLCSASGQADVPAAPPDDPPRMPQDSFDDPEGTCEPPDQPGFAGGAPTSPYEARPFEDRYGMTDPGEAGKLEVEWIQTQELMADGSVRGQQHGQWIVRQRKTQV